MTGGSYKKDIGFKNFFITDIKEQKGRDGEPLWIIETPDGELRTKDKKWRDRLKKGERFGIEYAISEFNNKKYKWITLVGLK